jgi:hypothetical protein
VTRSDRERFGLPTRLFLYTLDQIADMLRVADVSQFLHYEGITIGIQRRRTMLARNIAPPGAPEQWRVEEQEFIRWMKATGFTSMNRTYVD